MDPFARAPALRVPSAVALTSAKTLALGALLGALVATGTPANAPDRSAATGVPGAADRPACSASLIRTEQGDLRRVSFEVGWDVYTGRRPGTLVAACLDRRPDPGARPCLPSPGGAGRRRHPPLRERHALVVRSGAVPALAGREPLDALERPGPQAGEAVAQLVAHRLLLAHPLLLEHGEPVLAEADLR